MCELLGKQILANLKSQVIWSEVITVERSLEKYFEREEKPTKREEIEKKLKTIIQANKLISQQQ